MEKETGSIPGNGVTTGLCTGVSPVSNPASMEGLTGLRLCRDTVLGGGWLGMLENESLIRLAKGLGKACGNMAPVLNQQMSPRMC